MAKIDRASSLDSIKSSLGEGTENQTTTVRVGESKLSHVAQRLGVGEGSLREANPHVADVNKLNVGQELKLPLLKKGDGPAEPGSESAKGHAKSDLPLAPKGDPLASAAIKASLDAKDESINATTKLANLSLPQLESLISKAVSHALSQIPYPQLGRGAAEPHVNSGPPGFVNGSGHADFDPKSLNPGNIAQLGIAQLGQRAAGLGISQLGRGAAEPHVNSGPPGFVNGGGHANFDPKTLNPGNIAQLGIAQLGQRAGGLGISQLGRGAAEPHVNSGPPGFVNGGGHANFDPKTLNPGNIAQQGIAQLGQRAAGLGVSQLGLGAAEPHVNSGPPGFVNGGGHANFDPKTMNPGNSVMVTLPDQTNVTVPNQGRLNLAVNGYLITR